MLIISIAYDIFKLEILTVERELPFLFNPLSFYNEKFFNEYPFSTLQNYLIEQI